ncbi:MAG: GTPase RsgA [Terasakiella sp.]|uniref:GTPase RsgA n=1 Tax=unclassified Terasakiella TaxID=2614952 RepID=UPI003AFFC965
MKKDYSQFLPSTQQKDTPKYERNPLNTLGWQPFFLQQVTLETLQKNTPARIIEVHRGHLHIQGEHIDQLIPFVPNVTIGDWILYDEEAQQIRQVLDRKSLLQRRAPGTDRQQQLIAANIETAFIVTSCNHDFNIARLERYIALAFEAEITPVIVLTKTDLCENPALYIEKAAEISKKVFVVPLNACGHEPKERLADWCKTGQTVAFLGSSGVGKSTLVNALQGKITVETQNIRENDSEFGGQLPNYWK